MPCGCSDRGNAWGALVFFSKFFKTVKYVTMFTTVPTVTLVTTVDTATIVS